MASLLRIDVDNKALFAAMDAVVADLEVRLKAVAHETATRIASEAGVRVKRRTGKTASGITVAEAKKGDGYVVFVERPEQPGLPGWLEFGTKFIPASPFLFASARLEEGDHDRRARDAVQDALNARGLGDA